MKAVSLYEWQNALAARVAGVTAGSAESPGLAITRKVQHSWRRYRLEMGAPLTLAALAPYDPEAFIAGFLADRAWPSPFMATEAVAFAEYVRCTASDLPHVYSVACFERAMLLIQRDKTFPSAPGDSHGVRPHPAADVVLFRAEPARVLGALLRGEDPPPVEPVFHWLLLAPGLPKHGRPATQAESDLFALYRDGGGVPSGVDSEAHAGLVEAGALLVGGAHS